MDRRDDAILDKILRTRQVPEMRSNLEQRIIDAAARSSMSQSAPKKMGLVASLMNALDDLVSLPQPVVSLMVVIIIGAGIGLYSGEYYAPSSSQVEVSDEFEVYVLMGDDTNFGRML